MKDYNYIETKLNEEANKIVVLIKGDYYKYMSLEKKQLIDNLIKSKKIVIVNQGPSHFKDNTLAHSGRALNDGKIHFYPDVRNFKTMDEIIENCKQILPHECFHYFIQPDKINFENKLEKEMANFYTEGLVEKETRKFCERHKDNVAFKKANYGYNINFVNAIQEKLQATDYNIIFSENDYLKNIGQYTYEYKIILENKKEALKKFTSKKLDNKDEREL